MRYSNALQSNALLPSTVSMQCLVRVRLAYHSATASDALPFC